MIVNIYKYGLEKTLSEIERLSRNYLEDVKFLKGRTLIEIFDYVKNIEYKPDPKNMELVMRPIRLLERRSGDCDDKVVFMSAALLINNVPCGYSVVSQSVSKNWHHIFNFLIINGERKDFDATYPNNQPFKSKPWAKRKDFLL